MGAEEEDKTLKTAAFIFAGFSMMLNIRLCYSSAPYALIRFKLPEDLFSIFVRRMSSSLELWCLPSMLIGNVMDQLMKRGGVNKKNIITWPSIVCMWIDFLTYIILLIVYLMGGDQGHLTAHYWIIAFSGFNFGIEMVLVYAQDDDGTITWYMVGENSFPLFTSLVHYFTTLMFGNRRKWNSDYIVVFVDIIAAIMISFTAAMIWTIQFHSADSQKCTRLTLKGETSSGNELTYSSSKVACTNYLAAAAGHQHKPGLPTHTHHGANSGCEYDPHRWHNFSPVLMVLVGMGLVYMIYPAIAPGMIVPFYLVDRIDMVLLIATAVPPVIVATLKHKGYGPFVFLGNWGGKHTWWISPPISPAITQATLDLRNLTSTHTLTLKKSDGGTVQEVTYTVAGDQSGKINRIKNQNSEVTINLTLTLAEVTLALGGSTLTATGSITTTKTVTKSGGNTIENDLKTSHTLNLSSSSSSNTLTQSLGGTSVTIGPGGDKKELTLNAEATADGPTNLNLKLKPGTKPKSGGGVGEEPNDKLTLNSLNNTLTLTGGIAGQLTFSSGDLTANITGVSYDLNDFHYTSETTHQDYCCIGGTLVTWQSNSDPGMPVWHLCDVFVILMIVLAIIFVYSLHYRDSAIARSIINQPKMSTALSIIFYMCHEISLAVGFPGIASDDNIILPIQLVGAFLMVLLAPYSEGYLIEYKRHDPAHWPTEGMTKWNAFCYWYSFFIFW